MFYKEKKDGQILEEGINEAGSFSSWIAAATSYSNSGIQTIPFYIFYSMFGFQRIHDLAWAAGDSQAKGFLIGATSGRTTLNGEGLQHQDGHSHLFSATIPNCLSYDPAYAADDLADMVKNVAHGTGGDKNVLVQARFLTTGSGTPGKSVASFEASNAASCGSSCSISEQNTFKDSVVRYSTTVETTAKKYKEE